MEDLIDLLNTLAGFLPNSYLTDKLVSNTKSWTDVWQIIYEHYGVTITGETLLDFEDLYRENGETHRQFFERLLQHTKHHLAPVNVKVEQFETGAAPETMSYFHHEHGGCSVVEKDRPCFNQDCSHRVFNRLEG